MDDIFDSLKTVIPCETEWGKWWQQAEEVHIKVNLANGTKSKQIKIDSTDNLNISISVAGNIIFSVSFNTWYN